MPVGLCVILTAESVVLTLCPPAPLLRAGGHEVVPLVRFEAGEVGVDVAAFAIGEERKLPISPADGEPMKRLTAAEVEALPDAEIV